MQTVRNASKFEPENRSVICLDFSQFSRSIILEVLRGIGFSNECISFQTSADALDIGLDHVPDYVLLSHETDTELDYEMILQLRRKECPEESAVPIVLLSSQATRSMILRARDCGVDEIVMRPVSPLQLQSKLRQITESPRSFVTSAEYVGPCRRRKLSDNYSGSRRRLDDYKQNGSRDLPVEPGADELATAVSQLREACGQLAEERLGLVARVRQTAERTMMLARQTKDAPLEKTAYAMKLYLDGIGTKNSLETHVLETGINALTQLAILPNSYDGTRQSVANLMMVAVRKKLVVYEKRKASDEDLKSEVMLDEINTSAPGLHSDTPSPKKTA